MATVGYNKTKSEEKAESTLEKYQMEPERKKALMAMFHRLEDIRKPMEPIWEKVQEFILPYKINITETGAQLVLNQKLYNATSVSASRMAASFFVGTVTPRSIPWNQVIIRDEGIFRNRQVSTWCKNIEKHFNWRYENSNYYESQFPFVKLGLDYGTSARFIEKNPKDGTLNFDVLPNKTYYIDENAYGDVDVLWREVYMSPTQLFDRFTVDESTPLYQRIKNTKGLVKVLHATHPRQYADPESKWNLRFEFESLYILPDANWSLLEEAGFKSFPYSVFRPFYEPGLVYGIGPGIICARPAFISQKAGKSMIQAGEMAGDPAFNVPVNKRGKEDLLPGGRFYYENHQEVVSPISTGGQFPYGKDVLDTINEWVKEQYFIPEFLMLSSMENRDRTALEVSALQAERTPIVDTITASFTSGPLNHDMERIYAIDYEDGLIPPIPNVGQGVTDVVIDYIGPLAQQQRKFHKQIGIRQLMAEILPLAEVRPDVLDPIDFDAYDREIADANGANHILFDQEYVDQLRAARAQQQQAMQDQAMQQQEMIAQAEVAAKGAKKPESGSLAEKVQG